MRDIPGYEGRYAATSCGRIWSYKRKRFLTSCGEEGNYQIVMLFKEGKSCTPYVHRLIASAFLDNPNNYTEVHHKNHHKDDNRLCNLEWVSVSQNRKERLPWKWKKNS